MEKYIGKQVLVSNTNVQYTKRLLVGILLTNDPYSYICRDSSERKMTLIGWKYCKPIIEYPKYWLTTSKNTIIKQTEARKGEIVYSSEGYSGEFPCTNFEIYKELPYDKEKGLWHGQPIIGWDNDWTHIRQIMFYNTLNKCPFDFEGKSYNLNFDNIEAINPNKYDDWMLKTIKGIHNDMFND